MSNGIAIVGLILAGVGLTLLVEIALLYMVARRNARMLKKLKKLGERKGDRA
jgi:hypothetical protein